MSLIHPVFVFVGSMKFLFYWGVFLMKGNNKINTFLCNKKHKYNSKRYINNNISIHEKI